MYIHVRIIYLKKTDNVENNSAENKHILSKTKTMIKTRSTKVRGRPALLK